MGSIGNKPKKFRSTETVDEPEMLVDLDSVQKKAINGGYITNNRLDIERLIEDNFKDITIIKQPLASDVSGKLESKDGHWIMTVNNLHPEVRQRYTLGHELGHYLNHRKTVKEMAAKFDVSLEAMKYRLEELGYSVKKSI